ncbi:hypothetical protein PV04_05707 [Phialophora macrospora]|uniref:Uncharacterized protein n=1 Tax=Phialophora macrospora TaxID=1851006 RepID=A0A0D2CMB9_9EURO|nr:hypothetical protein PV04_05707 [Phialophora macrospora]
MPETRSSSDWTQLLDGVDRDLADEYNETIDRARRSNEKYAALFHRAQTILAHLVRARAELEQITALRQKGLY